MDQVHPSSSLVEVTYPYLASEDQAEVGKEAFPALEPVLAPGQYKHATPEDSDITVVVCAYQQAVVVVVAPACLALALALGALAAVAYSWALA